MIMNSTKNQTINNKEVKNQFEVYTSKIEIENVIFDTYGIKNNNFSIADVHSNIEKVQELVETLNTLPNDKEAMLKVIQWFIEYCG